MRSACGVSNWKLQGMKGVMESVQHTFIETHFDFFLEKERSIKNISYLCGGLSSLI